MTDQPQPEKDFLFNAKQRVNFAITTHQTDKKALLIATIANAEATIALAEEQRTANLIAYIGQAQSQVEDSNETAVRWLYEQTRAIRERLGLDA